MKYSKFLTILSEFGLNFTEKEKELFMQAFVANCNRDNILINISRLRNIKLAQKVKKLYDRVDMYEELDNPDIVDNSGYFGIFYREKKPLKQINEREFLDIIAGNNKIVSVMKNIKDIDKDSNGYVTNQELDDIFKMHYEKELSNRDIMTLFKPFASIQNRILIDYKKLRDHIMKRLKEREESNLSKEIASM